MNEQELQIKLLEVNEAIKHKLKRVIFSLITHTETNGRLSKENQHAVRILESRMRAFDREWNARFGDLVSKMRAEVELQCNSDTGELIQLGEKWHGKGRLDCRACDVEYELLTGTQIPSIIPLSSKCLYCKRGITHVFTRRDEGGYPYLPSTPQQLAISGQNQPNEVATVRVYQCDACTKLKLEVITCIQSDPVGWAGNQAEG
jgi:hypothetical protein